jgi:hypothetical protein
MEFKKFCLCILATFLVTVIYSQRQAYSTINGGCIYSINNCSSPNQGMIIKFNDDSLEQIIEPVDMSLATYYSRAAFSDTNGNLLFASNGWRLVDSSGAVLSYKLWRDEMPHPGGTPDTTDLLVTMGPLFLNDPGDSSKAYLFYGEYETYQFPPYTLNADTYFSYAYLDIPTQSLISQENTILDVITQSGNMQACRHGNGRDWWIIKPGIYQNSFYIGLLDPNGLIMEEIIIPEVVESVQARTFSQFSFNGDKFIHFAVAPDRLLYTYDFDRCSGTLSNMQLHDLSDSLMAGDINAMTLSPDGSKVYFKKGGYPQQIQGTLQYDLNTSQYYYVCFYASAPQLTPNGKTVLLQSFILNENNQYINTLSEIMNPNEFGAACNLIEHKYSIENNATFVMPSNYANFRLGVLEGSICDSLSTGIPTSLNYPSLRFKAYPNPVESSLTVEQDIPSLLNLKITDMFGRSVWQGKTIEHKTVLTHEIRTLTNGIYWLEIQDLKTGKRGGTKFLKE